MSSSKFKIILFTCALICLLCFSGCNKKASTPGSESTGTESAFTNEERCAIANVYVYTEKDKVGKKEYYLTMLEKAEKVKLLGVEEVQYQEGDKIVLKKIANIELSDGKKGYLEERNLALKPIIFTTDTQLFVRPDVTSKVINRVKKGQMAFVLETKEDDWTKIYIGKFGSSYINEAWVNGGYSDDPLIIRDAKDYENALSILENAAKETDAAKKNKLTTDALAILEKLSSGYSVISQLAKEKFDELSSVTYQGQTTTQTTDETTTNE
jgi:lipoprotein LenA